MENKNKYVLHQDSISEDAKTFDDFVFNYFNNLYPDTVQELLTEWKKIKNPQPTLQGDEK